MVILIVLVIAVIIAFEAPGLFRRKMWRELATFGVLMFIGAVLSLGRALKLPVPNPTRGIEAIFGPVTRYIENLLT